jgi:hypothetical protein
VILIYQMGKVASRSWYQAICAADPPGDPPVHIHQLSGSWRDRLAEILERPAPYQTIANPIMARDQLRRGTATLARIEDCRRAGETIRIITGVRDPLPRSISSLMFNADFYGHTDRPISMRAGATPEYLNRALRDIWASVFSEVEPAQSFEALARYSTGLYRTWFTDELKGVFGVDVMTTAFPATGPQLLSGSGVEVLAYRAEDMAPDAPSHRALLAAAGEFLGLPVRAFPQANTAQTRRSHPLYAALCERFRLPASLIDRIYGHEVVRHFYSPPEIASFKARWAEFPLGAA